MRLGGFAEAQDSEALEQTMGGIGAGITVGRVTVFGRGIYPQVAPGSYQVTGVLRTSDPFGDAVDTDFAFRVEIEDE
jgi:hypothetical protein